MNEDIKRILKSLKDKYDDIGLSYYPEDLLEPKDPKIMYNYIKQLQQENKELKQYLKATNKGLRKVIYKRKIWKRRYYKQKYILKSIERWLKIRIDAYEGRITLGKGYELTEVMNIELACDKRYLRHIQELKGSDNNGQNT